MALAWNAGWVNALRGSNPLSSATEVPVSQSLRTGTSSIHRLRVPSRSVVASSTGCGISYRCFRIPRRSWPNAPVQRGGVLSKVRDAELGAADGRSAGRQIARRFVAECVIVTACVSPRSLPAVCGLRLSSLFGTPAHKILHTCTHHERLKGTGPMTSQQPVRRGRSRSPRPADTVLMPVSMGRDTQ